MGPRLRPPAGRYVPSVDALLGAVTPRTRAILVPDLVGSKTDWAALRARAPAGIVLIEDSCDTITDTTHSDIAITSFYASHIITAGGCGGMVMFNDEAHKKRALMLRDWGRIGTNSEDVSERFGFSVDGIEYDFKFLYGFRGYNFKACEMNAAFGLVQLDKLPRFAAIRKAVRVVIITPLHFGRACARMLRSRRARDRARAEHRALLRAAGWHVLHAARELGGLRLARDATHAP